MLLVRVVGAIWGRRALTTELVRRELKLRYRGTVLGFVWTMINPLVFMVIYTLVVTYFFRIEIPKFPAFVLTGLLPWMMWFTEAMSSGTTCVVDHAPFVTNAVFPAEVLPLVAVGTGMMNFLFSLPVLLLLYVLFDVRLSVTAVALPLVMATQASLLLGLVYITATLNVFFRDMQYIVRHILTMTFYLTPILYDFARIPPQFHWILRLNPMTTVIDSYRRALFFGTWPNWRNLGLVLGLGAGLIAVGMGLFSAKKELFAEHL